MIDLNKQVLILIYSFCSGIIFGIGFDIYKSLINVKKNIVINFIKYSLYWVLLGIGVFYFLLYTQYAILSFYTYFYMFIGVIVYLKLISKGIFLKIKNILKKSYRFFKLLIKNILYAFSLIFRVFYKKKINKNI